MTFTMAPVRQKIENISSGEIKGQSLQVRELQSYYYYYYYFLSG